MGRNLTIYFPLRLPELDQEVERFKKEFDEFLKDSFTEEELESLGNKIDALAAVDVSVLSPELTVDEFEDSEAHRGLFEECKSILLLDNLPYLESNPFQVSWLEQFLKRFPLFLVDPGGFSALVARNEFLRELARFRNLEALVKTEPPAAPPLQHGTTAPVLPIDFLILDVYRELDRLQAEGKIVMALETVAPFEKARRLFAIMKEGKLDAHSLLRLSGMIPKDFDDNLEKLKFLLKKI